MLMTWPEWIVAMMYAPISIVGFTIVTLFAWLIVNVVAALVSLVVWD